MSPERIAFYHRLREDYSARIPDPPSTWRVPPLLVLCWDEPVPGGPLLKRVVFCGYYLEPVS